MKTSEKALALCHAIEAAGASEALTKASVLASALHTEIIKWEAIEHGCIEGAGRASLSEAIEEIASQDTTDEMHPSAHCEADFEGAYDRCIKVARQAQAERAR